MIYIMYLAWADDDLRNNIIGAEAGAGWLAGWLAGWSRHLDV